jgi:histone acetyltransferase MYST1
LFKTHHTLTPTLGDVAKACHLRLDDTAFAMEQLGFLNHTQPREEAVLVQLEGDDASVASEEFVVDKEGRWTGLEVVVTREMVLQACTTWNVKPAGVLDEQYVLL